jgi:hypothetical protein
MEGRFIIIGGLAISRTGPVPALIEAAGPQPFFHRQQDTSPAVKSKKKALKGPAGWA